MDKLEIQSGTIYEQGFGIISKKVMKDGKLSIESKAIYSYFCSYAGNGSAAFPGEDLICHDLNISRNRFYKYLKQLTKHGYITIRKDKDKGKFLRNVYNIMIVPRTQNEDMENEHINKNNNNKNNNVRKLKYQQRRKNGELNDYQLEQTANIASMEVQQRQQGRKEQAI